MGHGFETLSYSVWGACIEVQRQLGPHCMEVDYQRALELGLAKRGLEFIREAEIPITFDGIEVTRRRADFVVWDAAKRRLLKWAFSDPDSRASTSRSVRTARSRNGVSTGEPLS